MTPQNVLYLDIALDPNRPLTMSQWTWFSELILGGPLVWLRSTWSVPGSTSVGLEGGHEMSSPANENWTYWVAPPSSPDWGSRPLARAAGDGDRGHPWKWEPPADRTILHRPGDNTRHRFSERKNTCYIFINLNNTHYWFLCQVLFKVLKGKRDIQLTLSGAKVHATLGITLSVGQGWSVTSDFW